MKPSAISLWLVVISFLFLVFSNDAVMEAREHLNISIFLATSLICRAIEGQDK